MLITKQSLYSGNTHTNDIDITQEQYDAWMNGMLIQDAMPNISPDDREFLISGMVPSEWDEIVSGK